MAEIEATLGRWADRPGPLHRKLTDALREAVENGHLIGGERLPSERELGRRLAVSRSTVVTAYDALRAEGLLESRQGSGTRVRTSGSRTNGLQLPAMNPVYKSLLTESPNVISLAAAVLPAHPYLMEAFTEFAEQDAEKVLALPGYTPAGLPELRERIAELHTDEGLPTTPDQIVVTTGAQQAVTLATLLLVQPGDSVVVESPSFAGTLDAFRNRGARFLPIPVDANGINTRLVTERAPSQRPSAIYVMPSYHNPTGAQLSEPRREQLAQLAATEQIPVLEDNAMQFSPLDGSNLLPVAGYGPKDAPILSASSLSKAVWGGLRIGWLRAPVPLAGRLAELKGMSDLGSPLIDQAIATKIVPRLPELRDDHRTRLRHHYELVSNLLRTHTPGWEWERPRGGVSIWVRLPTGNAHTFAQVALRHGVEIIPGSVMSPYSEHQQNFRLPFTAEPPVLEETIRRLTRAWDAYAPRHDPTTTSSGSVVV